jgi:hypothetical protein
MTPEFFWGMVTGCGIAGLVAAFFINRTKHHKERDPADWWKDT